QPRGGPAARGRTGRPARPHAPLLRGEQARSRADRPRRSRRRLVRRPPQPRLGSGVRPAVPSVLPGHCPRPVLPPGPGRGAQAAGLRRQRRPPTRPAAGRPGRTGPRANVRPGRLRDDHLPGVAELIADRLGVRRPRTLPEPLVRAGALAGDVLRGLGYRDPPLSSFRLANMRADTSAVPVAAIRAVAGPLPFTLAAGVERTIDWLRRE